MSEGSAGSGPDGSAGSPPSAGAQVHRSPGGRSDEERRRRRGGGSDQRARAGFGDEVERAFCAHFQQVPPQTFPVQHRQNLATRKAVVVARGENLVVYCDGAHPGHHAWPDGTAIDPDTGAL